MFDWDKVSTRLIAPDSDFEDVEYHRERAKIELASAVAPELEPRKPYIVILDEKLHDNFGTPGYRLLQVRMHVQEGTLKGGRADDD